MQILALALLAAVTLPDTPAGRVFQTWFDALNSGNRERMEQYYRQYSPDRIQQVDRIMDFRKQTGGLELLRVIRSAERRIELEVKERNGETHALATLELAEGEPVRVARMTLEANPDPDAGREIPVMSEADALAALDAEAGKGFQGAIAVARGGRTIFEKAYGLADREKGVANTNATQFRLGSMNKMFTAVAALQLVEQGKLDLEAPLAKYLPDYPNKEVAAKVKVRHLLSHTGGTGDIFKPEYEARRLETREPKDYVALFGARALEFEPGTKWAYSNYGFVLLGYLVERVSGMSYYDYVRRHVFAPAGMTFTDSLPEEANVPLRARGYMRKNGAMALNTETLPWRGSPAGGGYSTTGDLLRFAAALQGGKLLKPATLKQATQRQSPAGGPAYGFGFVPSEGSMDGCYGHTGGAPGMNASLKICPGSVAVALSNADGSNAPRMVDFVLRRLPK